MYSRLGCCQRRTACVKLGELDALGGVLVRELLVVRSDVAALSTPGGVEVHHDLARRDELLELLRRGQDQKHEHTVVQTDPVAPPA